MARADDILTAAAELFFERGFGAVGVDQIGAKAGVTGPAIYRHFKGKDDILGTLFDQGMDDVIRVTGGRFDDPHIELAHICREHARHVLSKPHLASIWIREDRSLVEPYRSAFIRRAIRYLERWQECAGRAYPEADRERVAIAVDSVLGILNSLPNWQRELTRTSGFLDLLTSHAVASFRWLVDAPEAGIDSPLAAALAEPR